MNLSLLFSCDPNDPEIAAEAKNKAFLKNGLKQRQQSPIYKMIIDWKIALPLHPEYRTMPMVWYIPPLSPIMNMVEGKVVTGKQKRFSPAIDNMRIPIQYLANLLTAGDESHIRLTLKNGCYANIYESTAN